MSKYGIPYMGSKDKIAESICSVLPKADHFYDLFGGGFSITNCMLVNKRHKYKHFHYNEIKADIVDLVKRAINGEFNYDNFKPEWISREDFFKRRNDAYVRCCWSFGNNQKSYLFGDCERYKKSMHMAVVFDQFDSLSSDVLGFSAWPIEVKTIKQKRLYLRQKVEYYRKTKIPKILHQFLNEKQLERLQHLEQLERLEHLEQLERLERLERLDLTALDYRQVEIRDSAVVYCDIPYQGTAGYGAFDHKEFFDWAATRSFPVYISEYKINDSRFKLFYEVDKRSMLNSEKHKTLIKQERIYWNGVKSS